MKLFVLDADGRPVARLQRSHLFPRPTRAVLDRHGNLKWEWPSPDLVAQRSPIAVQTVPSELCFEFARLSEGPDEVIRKFAERWGPLYYKDGAAETVSEWRRYARLALALLRVGAQEDSSQDEDWAAIWDWLAPHQPFELKRLPRNQRLLFAAGAANLWYSLARGNGVLQVVKGEFQIQSHGANLFGILIAQIAHKMAGSDQKVTCAGCRRRFRAERPQSRGVRRYCPRCRREKKPARDAARDYRLRAKRAKESEPIYGISKRARPPAL